jgi:hypothetical protein
MKRHSLTAMLRRFDRETQRLQKIEWDKQTQRLRAIQVIRDTRVTTTEGRERT